MSGRKFKMTHRLFKEDYDYLMSVARYDQEPQNSSMARLVSALRGAGIKSFIELQLDLKNMTAK